jgi:hypothetical protein
MAKPFAEKYPIQTPVSRICARCINGIFMGFYGHISYVNSQVLKSLLRALPLH